MFVLVNNKCGITQVHSAVSTQLTNVQLVQDLRYKSGCTIIVRLGLPSISELIPARSG